MEKEIRLTGKKANIQAIKRAFGIDLPQSLTRQQIKKYICKNFYNTPKWGVYIQTLALVKCKNS